MPEGARKFLPLEQRGYSEKIPSEQLKPNAAEELAKRGAEKMRDDRLTGRNEPSVMIDPVYQAELQQKGLAVEGAPANHKEEIIELTDEDIELVSEPKTEPRLVSLDEATAELNPQGGGMARVEQAAATPPPIPKERAKAEAPGELRMVELNEKGEVINAGSAEQLPPQMDAERQAREKAEAEEKAFFEAQAKQQATEREVARQKLEAEKIEAARKLIKEFDTFANSTLVEREGRHLDRQRRLANEETIREQEHIAEISQAQANPEKLSPYSATLEQQNRELLSRRTDTLIGFVKDKWNIKLDRDGKPTLGSRLKGFFRKDKSAENDPLFQTIQVEIQKRYEQARKALK